MGIFILSFYTILSITWRNRARRQRAQRRPFPRSAHPRDGTRHRSLTFRPSLSTFPTFQLAGIFRHYTL